MTLTRLSSCPAAAAVVSAMLREAARFLDKWARALVPSSWVHMRQAKIKSSLTKYDYMLQQLPCEVLMLVKELVRCVRTGPVNNPYEKLESKLTASYQKSPWQMTFEQSGYARSRQQAAIGPHGC
jgi:hypothetical protein